MTTAVLCTGLTKAYGAAKAVDALDLRVEKGRILTLVGPSGCGKTTTLRIIAGFESPDSGTVEINGRKVVGHGFATPAEQRRIGMVFQDYALFPHLSVAHNVAFGLPRGADKRERVRAALQRVGLDGLQDRMPHELSGGQQQRVALARALAPEPDILLLDEPFSNLHAELRVQMREEVRDLLHGMGVTAIFVTHDQEEALFMGDLVGVMRDGRLEQVDTPEKVFHEPVNSFVARFLGPATFLPAFVKDGLVWTELGAAPVDSLQALPHDMEGFEVMVRPDDLVLIPDKDGQGVIVSRTFQGGFYLYRVALASGLATSAVMLHTSNHPRGARVTVRIDPGHALRCFRQGDLF